MELKYKYTSDFTGYLTNPIEVTSDLPQIANWLMDIVLDNQLYEYTNLLQKLQYLIKEYVEVLKLTADEEIHRLFLN